MVRRDPVRRDLKHAATAGCAAVAVGCADRPVDVKRASALGETLAKKMSPTGSTRSDSWESICNSVCGVAWADVVDDAVVALPDALVTQVLVTTPVGKTVTVDVNVQGTVADAKLAVEAKTAIPVEHQRLLFAGK